MTYISNLGEVRGKNGRIYKPHPVISDDNKVFLTWGNPIEDNDESLEPIEITPYVYMPEINEEGDITFRLTKADIAPLKTTPINIKGPIGNDGSIQVDFVPDDLENFKDMSEYKKEGTIYIYNGVGSVYDKDKNRWHDLDNMGWFNDYYNKNEIDRNFYTQSDINSMIGNMQRCQNEILHTLDKGSVDIPQDNGE